MDDDSKDISVKLVKYCVSVSFWPCAMTWARLQRRDTVGVSAKSAGWRPALKMQWKMQDRENEDSKKLNWSTVQQNACIRICYIVFHLWNLICRFQPCIFPSLNFFVVLHVSLPRYCIFQQPTCYSFSAVSLFFSIVATALLRSIDADILDARWCNYRHWSAEVWRTTVLWQSSLCITVVQPPLHAGL